MNSPAVRAPNAHMGTALIVRLKHLPSAQHRGAVNAVKGWAQREVSGNLPNEKHIINTVVPAERAHRVALRASRAPRIVVSMGKGR